MRTCLLTLAAAGLVLGLAAPSRAQDEVRALIDKAIKAHGGEARLEKVKAVEVKTKGNLEILGGVTFTQSSSAEVLTGKIKDVMELDIMGQKVTVTTVFDGQKGWIHVNGQTMDMDEKILGMMKEAAHTMRLSRMIVLKDKGFELSLVGEAKVNGRPAVGVKVSSPGHKDVNLYFDKETGLTAKTELRTIDIMTGQEVAEERIVLEYQDVEGQKAAKKLLINRDGKKFLELEVTEVKFPDSIDAGEFAKP